jgi:dolichol-phosphate mannosyltransferase
MKLSIIIPVYNEAENIAKTINRIEKEVKTPHQIIIVYDFKEDTTIPVVKKIQKENKNILLVKNSIENGRGVVKAIKTGFRLVKNGAVIVTMADLSDDPKTIDLMFEKLQQGYDIVCGSRYSKGGQKIGGPMIKSWLSKLSGLLTPVLLGIPTKDVTNAFKMYNKKAIEAIKIESRGGFELSMEIVIKAFHKGFKVTEVPTTWRDRTAGQSRFKILAWLPRYIYWYVWGVAARLKNSFQRINPK